MNEIKLAIKRFNRKKKNEEKQSRPYGDWSDPWNINSVLVDAIKFIQLRNYIKYYE